jgi:hypothetical protein
VLLTPSLARDKKPDSRSSELYPIKVRLGRRSGLETVAKEKFHTPSGNRIPHVPARSQSLYQTFKDEAQTALFKDPVRTAQ